VKKKNILVEGHLCIGPHFTAEKFALIKKNINQLEGLNTLADLLSVVGSAVRLKIVYLLYAHKELCVCDLKDKLIVKNRKDSQTVYYSLENKLFMDILSQYFVIPEVQKKFDLISTN